MSNETSENATAQKSCEIIPLSVLAAFRALGEPMQLEQIPMGLLNQTYVVRTPKHKYILQKLSSVFETSVTEDSLAVSSFLEHSGIKVPKPYLANDGRPFVVVPEGHFRALRFIEGQAYNAISSMAMVQSAGLVLGQFHRALMNFSYNYRSRRRHGGDYVAHSLVLIEALKIHTGHDYLAKAKELAPKMLEAMELRIRSLSVTPRHVHGDPKISNILFDSDQRAICLVDFDTLGKISWSWEVADALRSWCNPLAEDNLDAHVDLEIANSALEGYGEHMRGALNTDELLGIAQHSQAVSLCLAMRYLADMLNENYFRHDHQRFMRAAEHNWLRAQAMFKLYEDFVAKEQALLDLVFEYLGPR